MKIFGVVGWKNAGKTGLMERLVTEISGRGYRVSTIKHAHHEFDIDQPGKDSFRHRRAGAGEVLLASRIRWALMHEIGEADEPPLSALLERLSPTDLVLVEGYKWEGHAKIEVHRQATGAQLIARQDTSVVAMASDVVFAELTIPSINLDDTGAIADFILAHVGMMTGGSGVTPVRDDCFALPAGVDWVPVDRALEELRHRLTCCVATKIVPVDRAQSYILAVNVTAVRSNPPGANSAVDGYGFAHATLGEGANALPLAKSRAAAGAPFEGELPKGQAARILTGALLPDGVDTVVLQEDVTIVDDAVCFAGVVKPGANTRAAGEDIKAGEVALSKGQLLQAPELALLSAIGCTEIEVHEKLRVGVLSTGDEIVAPGSDLNPAKTYDANRPMLLGLVKRWGYVAVDLGHVGDDREALSAHLNSAAEEVDVILASGGASAGDEDHMSALLDETGSLISWRVAMKPGRPLALGMWRNTLILGLPGNPVAAMVCTLVFARPAMSVLAGAEWQKPVGFQVPAGFEKVKKPGRREYLRARINGEGSVEVFASEGSGRISGLSWAGGLVELHESARHIRPGDLVRYIPYGGFGL